MTQVSAARFAWLVVTATAAGCAADDVVVSRLSAGTADEGGLGTSGGTANGSSGGAAGAGIPVRSGGASSAGGAKEAGGTAPGSGGAGSGGGASPSGGAATAGGTVGDASAAGAAGAATTCSETSVCAAGWTCSKQLGCGAPTGLCEPRPVLCDPNPLPVCGCDQITYWNDCVRKQNGVTGSTPGQCGVGTRSCTVAADCGVAGAACSHVTPTPLPCSPLGLGTCWIVPVDCTGTSASPKWTPCQTMPVPPLNPMPCVNTCDAIRSGQQYSPAPPGALCQ